MLSIKYIELKKSDRETPSYGIIDSQSVKTVYASKERGIDGNKKIQGRKRHIVIDVLGDLMHVTVHAAHESDTKSACSILEETANKYPSIEAFSGDAGYRGTAVDFVKDTLNLNIHISVNLSDGFSILPKRWIVERNACLVGNISETIQGCRNTN